MHIAHTGDHELHSLFVAEGLGGKYKEARLDRDGWTILKNKAKTTLRSSSFALSIQFTK